MTRDRSPAKQRRWKHRGSRSILLRLCPGRHQVARPLHPPHAALMIIGLTSHRRESLLLRIFPPSESEDPAMLCRMVMMSAGLLMTAMLMVDFAVAGQTEDTGPPKPLRAGIIGLDTSHVVAFTQLLNAPAPQARASRCPRGGGLSGWEPRSSVKPRPSGWLHQRAARETRRGHRGLDR